MENIFEAWHDFKKGKRKRRDVSELEYILENNIFRLHEQLSLGRYRHGKYWQFRITDPKLRLISKAKVIDRLLHHAIHRVLYPVFDKTFIFDSYSCRIGKGTHKSFDRLNQMIRKISQNHTRPCWVLKCDIRKFFDSVDHQILLDLLKERIDDPKLIRLLSIIIGSFEFAPGRGIPLGNLTSQLFANIYLDVLDKFVKHQLGVSHYIRYADDFVFLSDDPDDLAGYLVEINRFLQERLKLQLHPDKIILRKHIWGIDYVGYISLPKANLLRKRTVQRIRQHLKKWIKSGDSESITKALPSYIGYLQHASSYAVQSELKEITGYVTKPLGYPQ